ASFMPHASADLSGIQLSCGERSASAASFHAFSHSLGHLPSLSPATSDCSRFVSRPSGPHELMFYGTEVTIERAGGPSASEVKLTLPDERRTSAVDPER